MGCRYCGKGGPVRLVAIGFSNSGPGLPVYACRSCRVARDLPPVDEGPAAPDLRGAADVPQECVYCRRDTHAPVVVGQGRYACHACGWKRCLDHIAECADCHAIGGKCREARTQWRALQESRVIYLTPRDK